MIRFSRYARFPLFTIAVSAVAVLSASAPDVKPDMAPKPASRPAPHPPSQKAPPRDPLSGFRDLATELWTQGPGSDSGVVLEYRLNRPAIACTGGEPEVRLRLFGDGRLELLRTRSYTESDFAGPGSFAGRIGKKTWDSVFAQVSGMEWETALPGLPMPGMSETDRVIELRLAGRTARFESSGTVPAGHDRIADGLSAVTGMIRAATADTLWSLRFGAEAGKYKQGVLRVRASWILRGNTPVRFRLPVEGGENGCGSLGLRWSLQPKDVQGFTAVPSEKNLAFPKNGLKMEGMNDGKGDRKVDRKIAGKPAGAGQAIDPGTWRELQPGDSISVSGEFPVPKAKNSSRVEREGSLMHLGIPVAMAGREDTSAVVTLFSGYFRF